MLTELLLLDAIPFMAVYDGADYPSAFTPELWANESIAILEENMVIGNLVHRDFENVIASYGDVVNTRKPGEFKAVRKTASDSVTVQANTATNVPVPLNQHLHTSFIIKDADQSLAFKDLVVEYLRPAMLSIARAIDLIVGGQVYQFRNNFGGQLGQLSGTNAQNFLLQTRQTLNKNKAYEWGRNLILGTVSETTLLEDQDFTRAYAVGDDGSALREANLGRKFGFDIFLAQNQPYVPTGNTVKSGTTSAAAAVGATTLALTGFSTAIAAGSWLTVVGDGSPLQLVSSTGGSTPTALVLDRALQGAVASGAAVTIYSPGAVDTNGPYAVGFDKEIGIASGTCYNSQLISFGTSTTGPVYSIIDTDGSTYIVLDRPLEASVASSAAFNPGPAGSYNFAFHKNAIALVNRPLALPMPGTGARAGVAQYNGLSMRVVITYDGNQQGHLVTCDTLLGVAILDHNLGACMYG